MKMFHFKEARSCAEYMMKIKPDYSNSKVLLAQVTYYDAFATIPEV